MSHSTQFHELDGALLRHILSYVTSHAPSALLHHAMQLAAIHGNVRQIEAAQALHARASTLAYLIKSFATLHPTFMPSFRCAACLHDLDNLAHAPELALLMEVKVPTLDMVHLSVHTGVVGPRDLHGGDYAL